MNNRGTNHLKCVEVVAESHSQHTHQALGVVEDRCFKAWNHHWCGLLVKSRGNYYKIINETPKYSQQMFIYSVHLLKFNSKWLPQLINLTVKKKIPI